MTSVGGAALVGLAVALVPAAMFLITARRFDTYVDAARRMTLVLLAIPIASALAYLLQHL